VASAEEDTLAFAPHKVVEVVAVEVADNLNVVALVDIVVVVAFYHLQSNII
jgi:hypothetical protein